MSTSVIAGDIDYGRGIPMNRITRVVSGLASLLWLLGFLSMAEAQSGLTEKQQALMDAAFEGKLDTWNGWSRGNPSTRPIRKNTHP